MPKGGKGGRKKSSGNAASKAAQQNWYLIYGGVLDSGMYAADSSTKRPGKPPGKPGGVTITDPTDIPGVVLWLDGADIDTMYRTAGSQPFGLGSTPVTADNQAVLSWADKSGNGNHMNQTDNPIYGPKYRTGIQNGLSAIQGIAASTYYLKSTQSVLSQTSNIIVFYAGKAAADETLGGVFSCTNTATARHSCYIDSINAQRLGAIFRDSAGSNFGSLPSDIGTGFNQFTSIVQSSSIKIRLNGTSGLTDSFSGDGSTTNDYTRIMCDISETYCLGGYLGELIVVDGNLSDEWISAVETYLKNKWATP